MNISKDLEEQIELIVNDEGLVLYDLLSLKEDSRDIFRVVVTLPKESDSSNRLNATSIDIDKCAKISRLISPLLDVEGAMNAEYNLEVSSPGIERKLKTTKHFILSIGEMLKIKDFNGDVIKGRLIKADNNEIFLSTKHGEESISYDEISTASTFFQWNKR